MLGSLFQLADPLTSDPGLLRKFLLRTGCKAKLPITEDRDFAFRKLTDNFVQVSGEIVICGAVTGDGVRGGTKKAV